MAGSLISAAGSIAGGILGKKAADKQSQAAIRASQIQTQGMERALDKSLGLQREMWETGRADVSPFREVGLNAATTLSDMFLNGDTSKFTQSPGYQFAFDEGQRALERGAAARGLLTSGATGRALVDYGQGMASQEFNTYANRLQQLAGMGANAAVGQASNATNVGANMGQTAMTGMTNIGTAQAAGIAGAANASAFGQQQFARGLGGAFGNVATGVSNFDFGNLFNSSGGGALPFTNTPSAGVPSAFGFSAF